MTVGNLLADFGTRCCLGLSRAIDTLCCFVMSGSQPAICRSDGIMPNGNAGRMTRNMEVMLVRFFKSRLKTDYNVKRGLQAKGDFLKSKSELVGHKR